MKLMTLIVFCLFGFWIVSYVIDFINRNKKSSGESYGQNQDKSNGSRNENNGQKNRSSHESELDKACHILQITMPCSAEELKRAYRLRMAEYHPDKVSTLGSELRELAEKKTKEINVAYEILQRYCL